MELEFKGKYIISSKIVCETGLHIGGITEGFEIGGLDNPVIKDPLTERPYIPGSSLKGKLRHLLEWSLGRNMFNNKPFHFTESETTDEPAFGPCSCGQCEACVIFGVTPESGVKKEEPKPEGFATSYKVKEVVFSIPGPTRITIRDSFPTSDTIVEWELLLGKSIHTELKTENALDRVTSEANPRTMERVPKGSEFTFDAIFDVYNARDKELLKSFFTALHLLENSALGGSGSRGSGEVRFEDISVEFRPITYYNTGKGQKIVDLKGSDTPEELLSNFDAIDWEI